jgi:hypothetical protein
VDRPADLERMRAELSDAAGAEPVGSVPARTLRFIEDLLRDGRLPYRR